MVVLQNSPQKWQMKAQQSCDSFSITNKVCDKVNPDLGLQSCQKTTNLGL